MFFFAACVACGEEVQDPARPEPGNPPTEIFAKSNAESEVKLVTERFGRPVPNKLHWSVDPAVCRKFEPTGFGDQIISIHVETPSKLSSEQKEIFERLAALEEGHSNPMSRGFLDRVKDLFQ